MLVGLDAPDDAAVVKALPSGMAAVHTVDFFRSFGIDPFVFGRISAVHALSDCHAMGARPITALAIVVVPFGVEAVRAQALLCATLANVSCVCQCQRGSSAEKLWCLMKALPPGSASSRSTTGRRSEPVVKNSMKNARVNVSWAGKKPLTGFE